jgi:hypothetical protein
VGAYYFTEYLEALSLLFCLVGLAICCGGKRALYWSWPSIAFLFFMTEYPHKKDRRYRGIQSLRRLSKQHAASTISEALSSGEGVHHS